MKNINSLKNNNDFQKVYKYRKSFANKYLIMYVKPNNREDHRLGISVSKKVGNSVVRHGFCRLVRESYRLNKGRIKDSYDIVIVARPEAKDKNFHDIESAMIHLLKLHRLLK